MEGDDRSENSCVRVGEVERSYRHEHHDGGSKIKVSLSSPTFSISSSKRRHKSEPGKTDRPFCPRLVGYGRDQRNSQGQQSSSLFLPHVLRSQETRQSEAHHRSIGTQQAVSGAQIQNGDSGQNNTEHLRGSLGHVGGHYGCLPSCPNRLGVSRLLRLCSRREDVRFSGSTIRLILGSMDLFKGYEANKEIPSFLGSAGILFFGRFPNLGCVTTLDRFVHQDHYRSPSEVGVQSELGEIFNCPSATIGVLGDNFGPTEFLSFASFGKDREDPSLCGDGFSGEPDVTQRLGKTRRVSQLYCTVSPLGTSLSNSCDVLDESSHLNSIKGHSCPSGRRSENCLAPLVGHGSFVNSCANASSSSICGDHDGRFGAGLERLALARRSIWHVGSRVSFPVYQLERAKSYPFDSSSFWGSFERSGSQDPYRQHHGCGLYTPPGFCQFVIPLGIVEGYLDLCSRHGHGSYSCAPEWCLECFSGHGFQRGSHFHRVVYRSSIILGYLRFSGFYSRSGFVCNAIQFAVAYFCFPVPRPFRCWPGCSESGLEQMEFNLSFSSHPDSSRGHQEARPLLGHRFSSGAQLGVGQLVSFSVEEIAEELPSSSEILPIPTDQQRDVSVRPSSSFHLEPDRLDSITNGYTKKGYGANSIRILLENHREGTVKQYQHAWSLFLKFLSFRSIPHSSISLGDVLEFLAYYHDLGRAYYTLAGYRCALRLPLRLECQLLLDCDDSEVFMRGLYNRRPPPKAGTCKPDWLLSDLLLFLKSDTFEPLETKPIRIMTKKVLALTLLATGRRIDDVSSFTRFYRSEAQGSILRFSVPDSHRSKNEMRGFIPEDSTVLSLVSAHPGDELLCPVRALKIYLERRDTLENRANDFRLWMDSKEILSYAISSLIIEARAAAGHTDFVKCGPHHLRKFAASYSKACWGRSFKQVLFKRMGSKSMTVLNRVYVNDVPRLSVPCVVPMGTVIMDAT